MATFSDNFNRSNTAPGDLGSDYGILSPGATLQVLSGRVVGEGRALYTAGQTDAANQLVSGLIKITSSDPITRRAGFILRGGTIVDAPAVGSIELTANPSDGETITVDDGVNPAVTFEFESGGGVGVGNVAVTIGIDSDVTTANLLTELQGAALDITSALDGSNPSKINLTNDANGPTGNIPLTTTSGSVTLVGMAGGVLNLAGDANTGYIVGIEITNLTYYFVIWKIYNGVLVELDRSGSNLAVVGSDVSIRASVSGTGIQIVNPNNGSILASAADSDISGPGYVGLDLGVDVGAGTLALDNLYFEDLTGPVPPFRPIASCSNITTDGVTITGSQFYDQNLDTHKATQYQIDLETGDFSTPAVDVTVVTGSAGPGDIELIEKAFTGLLSNTQYKKRIRYQDSTDLWSEWSPIVYFSTLPTTSPISRQVYREIVREVSCDDAPNDIYRYTLVVNDTLQKVWVSKLELPNGSLYSFGDIIPSCVNDDIKTEMDVIIAAFP